MENGIYINNIWMDDSIIELKINANNGHLEFTNKVYISSQDLICIVEELKDFKSKIYGGLYDLQIGTFGQEYANGAFWGRFHFQRKGQICITIKMESDFHEFGKKYIADEAKLYMITEPTLLDEFITTLSKVYEKVGNTSRLKCLVD